MGRRRSQSVAEANFGEVRTESPTKCRRAMRGSMQDRVTRFEEAEIAPAWIGLPNWVACWSAIFLLDI